MKFIKTIILVIVIASFSLTSFTVFAKPGKGNRFKNRTTVCEERKAQWESLTEEEKAAKRAEIRAKIAEVLEEAGVPLTPEQIAALDLIDPGRENREERRSILTDEQKEALKNARPLGILKCEEDEE